MKIVVDTNILFSYFWHNSLTKRLLETSNFELVSPTTSLTEITKYKGEIMAKVGITGNEFSNFFSKLKKIVKFVNKSNYKSHIKEAQGISPDKDDVDFFALCLKENTFLWSNDSLLKNQTKVDVLSTKEVIELLFD